MTDQLRPKVSSLEIMRCSGLQNDPYRGRSICGGLVLRTLPALPSWCKTQTRNITATEEVMSHRMGHIFMAVTPEKPGRLAGFYNVQSQSLNIQQTKTNQRPVGFFNDINIDPACAGSLTVQTYAINRNPALAGFSHVIG